MLGTIPLPPLPDQDLPTAKRELETFRSEAGAILGEANAADDLSAPLAVAAAEAENLTLAQLGNATMHIPVPEAPLDKYVVYAFKLLKCAMGCERSLYGCGRRHMVHPTASRVTLLASSSARSPQQCIPQHAVSPL